MQQHAQTLKLLKEIRREQTSQQSNVLQAPLSSNTPLKELEAVSVQLAEQGKKLDLGYSQTLQLREQVNTFMQGQQHDHQLSQRQQRKGPSGENTEEGGTWTDVVKRNTPRNKTPRGNVTAVSNTAKRKPPKAAEGAKPPRNKLPAIIVRLKDGGYSEALKKLKGSDQVKAASDNIVGLTKTRNGDLLIRVKTASESSSQLMDAVGTAMGDRSVVMELVQYQKIVIQDLDEIAEAEEIIGAISCIDNTTAKEASVVSTMLQPRGQKWAIVSLPATLAGKVLSAGKLRVGYVSCRVRLWEERRKGRCPRCLIVGHARVDCKGP